MRHLQAIAHVEGEIIAKLLNVCLHIAHSAFLLRSVFLGVLSKSRYHSDARFKEVLLLAGQIIHAQGQRHVRKRIAVG